MWLNIADLKQSNFAEMKKSEPNVRKSQNIKFKCCLRPTNLQGG